MGESASVPLDEITAYLDDTLEVSTVPDYPGAVNGLQVENSGTVTKIATAVDASLETIDGAVAAGADLLVVHHGLFWSGVQPLRGRIYQRFQTIIANDLAIYSAHLPLDIHPTLGNNALLARELGLEPMDGFGQFKSISVGLMGSGDIDTSLIARRLASIAKAEGGSLVTVGDVEGKRTYSWALCTGAGASSDSLREAAGAGVDTLITGEGPHHTAVEARELGMTVFYAGHYATETFGVRAVGEHLSERFGLPWTFIDAPTGL